MRTAPHVHAQGLSQVSQRGLSEPGAAIQKTHLRDLSTRTHSFG